MISVQQAVKRYATVVAVDGVSLEARPGEVTALLGPNGAGKTSLLRMIVGLTRPDAGSVRITPAARRALGYLPEERGLYQGVSCLRTLRFVGRLHGLDRREADRRARAWLERLGLADRADDKVETLSRGNQQKLQLAAAVLHEPAVAVLDEPFSGLDPLNQDLFLALLAELRARGATILLSAHEMSLVERVADALVLLRGGRVALAGPLAELQRQAGAGDVYELELAAPIAPAAVASAPGVVSMETITPTRLRVVTTAAVGPVVAAVGPDLLLSIHRSRVTLHDLYVRTVGAGAEEAA